jgi:hypothetical protein
MGRPKTGRHAASSRASLFVRKGRGPAKDRKGGWCANGEQRQALASATPIGSMSKRPRRLRIRDIGRYQCSCVCVMEKLELSAEFRTLKICAEE